MNFWYIFTALFCTCGNGVFVSCLKMRGKHPFFQNVNEVNGHDPGTCDGTNWNVVVSLLDRQDREKRVICAVQNNIFSWIPIHGSNPPGEFFNPAYDCSDVLDKSNNNAKDGFYWVKYDSKIPKKVWCDMSTDGGGYMLLARTKKTSASNNIWSIPSSNAPVEPFGTPHWSSAFGDAPFLDFRVQIAEQDNFDDTKAHWSFRLRNNRQIKNLMLFDKGGCTGRSPGLGDIASVKNLLTGKIVTTTFRCSIFGGYHRASFQMGWAMLNSCLRRPCSGFGYHPTYHILVDDSGAFSYSATKNSSGITKDSTAFIGCNKGKCCGCFGPINGNEDYCKTECETKNGGNILRRVSSWIWVRSTLPKRTEVKVKCREYGTINRKGDEIWFKVWGEGNMTKGRCPKINETTNGGVSTNKSIKGRAKNKTYSRQLQMQLENLNQTIIINLSRFLSRLGDFSSSFILGGNKEYIKLLLQWIPVQYPSWNLCYRASQDGWQGRVFHSRCDYKGETVTIIRSGNYIFGGYTDASWGGPHGRRWSKKAFIFSFSNKDNLKPFKLSINTERNFISAIYTSYRSGPMFGVHDIYISSDAAKPRTCFANIGRVYQPPPGYRYKTWKARQLLAGSTAFTVSEIEVFYLR